MPRKKIIQIILGLALVLAFGIKSFYIKNPILVGQTMGTSYSITLKGSVSRRAIAQLSREIEETLVEISQHMSTWDPTSEISRFNQSTSTVPFRVSAPFAQVVRSALALSRSSGGAFDPTLQPLLNLWGFGSQAEERKVPSDAEIAVAKAQTGWRKLQVDEADHLQKRTPTLALNLGSIAKGYGVDALAQLLDQKGHENWFAEIGGEVVVRGTNPDDVPWRIGIEWPTTNPMMEKLKGIVHLSEGAVATSGSYHNYIEEGGVIYSHILDPRSGRAVLSDTASVTVIAPRCMIADGMATALFVMGADEGLAWVERQPNVEAMFLVRDSAGEITEQFSSGFVVATGYISIPHVSH